MFIYSCSPSLFQMAYWNPSICQQEDLPVQHVLLRKWGDGLSVGHLPNVVESLLKVNGYNHAPLYIGTWGSFDGRAPVWCVQVMLYKKQLSYRVCVVWHTFYVAPQATLDAGVQDVAHQALMAFCQELRDLDSQWLSEKEKEYVQKIEDLQAWERVHEWKIQSLQALSFAQKGIIQSLRGQLWNIGEDVDDEQDELTLDDYDVEDY
jgi:hypothetical protein